MTTTLAFFGWWNELGAAQQFFYGIGLIAFAALIVQILLTLIGGLDDMDLDVGHHDALGGFISIRGITAFFFGFGWTGAIALRSGFSIPGATALGFGAGLVMMVLLGLAIRTMAGFRTDGTLQMSSAVGKTGTVYVRVPAKRGGLGKIQILVQSRQAIMEAWTDEEQDLTSGMLVEVTGTVGGDALLVKKA
jgi:hypothetical protein